MTTANFGFGAAGGCGRCGPVRPSAGPVRGRGRGGVLSLERRGVRLALLRSDEDDFASVELGPADRTGRPLARASSPATFHTANASRPRRATSARTRESHGAVPHRRAPLRFSRSAGLADRPNAAQRSAEAKPESLSSSTLAPPFPSAIASESPGRLGTSGRYKWCGPVCQTAGRTGSGTWSSWCLES